MNIEARNRLAESADDYPHEIIRSNRHRVIRCRNGIQWIIQRRRAVGSQWDGRHYCATRKALIELWQAETGESGPAALASLPITITGVA
ncbi:hypothetical protein [Qingshengfaniella alkalisoli]|uniref:hypothetical protein n=1 Tax=Qingshengfaniella alkalisoli TaxID=2599296 RepID=UPI00143DFF2B|nr:hypothetical protein [Qingshengfaniella alkalisoli]